jgi:flagellar hook protein FlgE
VLRSLFSGITGLRQHQTLMDVVSNNIANVNTTGFKASSAVFEDTLSQLLKPAAGATAGTGGINPAQVGLGVQLAGISTNFGQGSAQNTGRSTDLMIQGDGFFVTRSGTEQTYTRAGSFTFDSNGTLVTPEGRIVQGWTADSTGVVNTDNQIGDVMVPAATLTPPVASTLVTAGGNITAGTTTTLTLGATGYDTAGKSHALSITIAWNATNSNYDVTVVDDSDPTSTATAGVLAFDTAGKYDATNSTVPAIQFKDSTGADLGVPVTLDLTGITSYGGPKSLAVTATDGASAGTLQQFQIQSDGSVVGMFSNGQKKVMAQIALANFNNPMGLQKVGETSFTSTTNSGLAQIGTAGSGGRGDLLGGAIEMSNVDLAQEFTNLIIAQRGFQANSRVITTSDQMLQDLVDLKR